MFNHACKLWRMRTQDVRNATSGHTNGLETFWLAETLKYFWLLFGPKDALHWNEWILNTEAHPLRLHTLEVVPNSSVASLNAARTIA